MKVQIIAGVMIAGTSVFPKVKSPDGKKELDTVIDVSKVDARALITSGHAKLAAKGAKVTLEIKEPEPAEDALNDFFGEDSEDDEE